MGKEDGHAGEDAPAGRELAFHTEIQKVVEVVDLSVGLGAHDVFDVTGEMAVARLVAVADGNRPLSGMEVIFAAASPLCEYAKPGRTLSCRNSTLAGGGASPGNEQEREGQQRKG